jgi:hypoxanthine phosphoribosyltransferase
MDQRDDAPDAQRSTDAGPAFAHVSEAEFARILDYYEVRWEYEPHTFPILWNTSGDLLESFSPDFFLPELDLYVELTTLRQKLVRKKNRKLRRLRELYPELRIKLFYARDFRALMLKYGRLELAEELSGTAGHVTPMRSAASMLAGPFGADRIVPVAEPLATEASPTAAGLGMGADPLAGPVPAHHRRRRRGAARIAAAAERARAGA